MGHPVGQLDFFLSFIIQVPLGRSFNQFLHPGFQGFDIHRFFNESGNVIQVQIRILPQPRVGGADKGRYRVGDSSNFG
jgi:hypothetical protein